MTIRAIIFGFLGSAFISNVGYINDQYIRVNLMAGNHLPTSEFGTMFMVMAVFNPLIGRFRRGWGPRISGLAVMLTLTLMPCAITSSGLMRTFSTTFIMPIQHNEVIVGR